MANGRLPNGILQKLSDKTGKPVKYLSDMANASKRPGRKLSKHLEKHTGIEASVWLFGTASEIKSALIENFS